MNTILFILSVLPAAVLMFYIMRKDKAEKEPLPLLAGLFALGAVSVIGAGFGEVLITEPLSEIVAEDSTVYLLIENFLVVALCEEGLKFLILKGRTWRNPHFNYTFDAVVYAVTVSLGFATAENIMYVLMDGTYHLAIMRGFLSVPGHAIDAVFMGCFYGKAKLCSCRGDASGCRSGLAVALIAPVLTHGFYDFCLTHGSDLFIGIFIVFEIVITIYAFLKVRSLSKGDTPLYPAGMPFGQYVQYYADPNSRIYAQYQGYQYQPYQAPQYGQPQQYGQQYRAPQYGQPQQYGQQYRAPQYGQQYRAPQYGQQPMYGQQDGRQGGNSSDFVEKLRREENKNGMQ